MLGQSTPDAGKRDASGRERIISLSLVRKLDIGRADSWAIINAYRETKTTPYIRASVLCGGTREVAARGAQTPVRDDNE